MAKTYQRVVGLMGEIYEIIESLMGKLCEIRVSPNGWIRNSPLKGEREREIEMINGLRGSLFAYTPILSHVRKIKKQNTSDQ